MSDCLDSPRHPLLQRLAGEYAAAMARKGRQDGHHGFAKRAAEIQRELGLQAREITAESWRWEANASEAELWQSAMDAWRSSAGHWAVASRPHTWAGAAMAKSRRGVWFFCVITVDG
jgi:hypothetical protein